MNWLITLYCFYLFVFFTSNCCFRIKVYHVLLCMSRNTGQINPAGFQSLKYMYYTHVIMTIKWFLTLTLTLTLTDVAFLTFQVMWGPIDHLMAQFMQHCTNNMHWVADIAGLNVDSNQLTRLTKSGIVFRGCQPFDLEYNPPPPPSPPPPPPLLAKRHLPI